MTRATIIIATAIPIPRPALAPVVICRFEREIGSGDAVAVVTRRGNKAIDRVLKLEKVDIVAVATIEYWCYSASEITKEENC